MSLFDNDVLLLPKKNNGVILDLIENRIWCSMPSTERSLKIKLSRGIKELALKIPSYLWMQRWSFNNSLHFQEDFGDYGCKCEKCITKSRITSDLRILSSVSSKKAVGFKFANVGRAGDICWGGNSKVYNNMRMADVAFWNSIFNMDMFPGGNEHTIYCKTREHTCKLRQEGSLHQLVHICENKNKGMSCTQQLHSCATAEKVLKSLQDSTYYYRSGPCSYSCSCCNLRCNCKSCKCCSYHCSCSISCKCCKLDCRCPCNCGLEEKFLHHLLNFQVEDENVYCYWLDFMTNEDERIKFGIPGCEAIFLSQNQFLLDSVTPNKLTTWNNRPLVVGWAYLETDYWRIILDDEEEFKIHKKYVNISDSEGRTFQTTPNEYYSKRPINYKKFKQSKIISV